MYAAIGPLPAGEVSALRKLSTADDTRGWEGVGRVDIGRRGFCTGTLIEPSLVLTAAHCMYDRDSGNRIDDADITFKAGFRDGRAEAYRGARRVTIHPDYDFTGFDDISRSARDLALIELDQPIRQHGIPPFGTSAADLGIGAKVELVSYAMERAEAPSLQEECHVVGLQPGLLILDCDVNFGSSGSPVFVRQGGFSEVVSVVSAKGEWRDRKVALATTVTGPLQDLMKLRENQSGLLHSARPGRDGLSGRTQNGAKFIRP
ncbi:trypsin [Maritimibacter sp. 55A14]|nr:trypsin [Maritimibacter sp. 55A14]